MAYDAGNAFITLVPSMRGFATTVDAEMAKIGKAAGDVFARTFNQAVGGATNGINIGPGTAAATRQGQSTGGAFADGLKARLQAALRDLPPASVNLRSDADREIARIRVALRDLSGQRVGIDIDEVTALARIDELSARLKVLSTGASDIRVRVDAAAALAELEGIDRAASRLDGRNIDLDTRVSTANVSTLAAGIIGLGPALIPIGAAAIAGIGAIGAAAGASIGAVAVLALGLSGVSDAVKTLGGMRAAQAQDDARAAAAASARASAEQAAARQLESAEASLSNTRRQAAAAAVSAAQQIGNARRALADAEEQAARRVQDAESNLAQVQQQRARAVQAAQRALADAQRQASDLIARALQSQQRAEENLAKAQRESLQAQQDLLLARKDAAQQLEDLDTRVKDGALAQRQGVLDVTSAQDALNQTLKDPTATDAQRAQAQLTYDAAVQHLAELQAQNQRLAEQQAAAAKAGVDGAAQVVAAQQQVADSATAVKDAQAASADAAAAVAQAQVDAAGRVRLAQQGLVQAQVDGAARVRDAQQAVTDAQNAGAAQVTKAQQGVADAVRAQATQQAQAAASIAGSQRQVQDALEAVAKASVETGTAGLTAVEKLQAKLDRLSPTALAFAEFLNGPVRGAVNGLKATAQENLLPGLQSGLEALLPLMPSVNQLVGTLASSMGTLFREAGQALGSPFWQQFFAYMNATAGPIITGIGHVIGNLAQGFAGLLMAFQPVADQVGRGILGLAQRFAAFGVGAGGSSSFQSFINYLQTEGPVVARFFGDLTVLVGKLIQALAPLGAVVLGALAGIVGFLSRLDPGALLAIGEAAAGLFLAFKVGLIALKVSLLDTATATAILNAVMEANPFGLLVIAIAALVAAFIYAYKNSETFRDIVNGVFSAMKRVAVDALDGIVKGLQFVLDYYLKMLELLGHVPGFGWAKDAAETVRNLGLKVDDLTQSHDQSSAAAVQLKANQDALRTAQNSLKAATGSLNDELQKSISKFTILRQGSLDQATATSGLAAATDALRQSLVTNGATLDVNTTSGRANQQAVLDVARALNDKVTADFKANESTKGLGSAMDTASTQIATNRQRLIDIMTQSGLTSNAAKGLVDQILLTPAQVRTAFQTPGLTAAHAQVDTLKDKVDGLKDKNVKISFSYENLAHAPGSQGEGGTKGLTLFAAGGWTGPGSKYQPAGVVHADEYVIRKESQRRLSAEVPGLLDYLNVHGQMPGYAGGGVVRRKVDIAGVLPPFADMSDRIDQTFQKLLQAIISQVRPAGLPGGDDPPAAGQSGLLGPAGPGDYPSLIAYLQSTHLPFRVNSTIGGTHAAGSYHYQGRAVDFGPAGLSSSSAEGQAVMMRIFEAFLPIAAQLKELFFTPAGFSLKNGQRVAPIAAAGHYNHVHAAYDQGGYAQPGITTIMNGLGAPEPVLTPSQWSDTSTLAARGATGGGVATLAREDRALLERLAERPVSVMVRERVLAETVRDYSAQRTSHGDPAWA